MARVSRESRIPHPSGNYSSVIFSPRYVQTADALLDLGCGYGEFINASPCGEKFAMDLNPDAPRFLLKG